ncbi:beta-N-acetylglucosaminidase domain-containing protein [Kineobactrum sediminis]|uniref:beta-N-acetylglucosaminidase domain-containing protein n=1 Tax=Kineobactrum sediminis TaxID=1905677 RepID=UPI0013906C48|nr:beta-N-acetylglucosaminidase domain-containing protein [Kineobactrum sediminis]
MVIPTAREPAAPTFLSGVIEGFYGRPWSHQVRMDYADYLSQLGLNSYIYAPKADPWLRRQWQRHWPREEWLGLQELAQHFARLGISFGIGLSPFALYAEYGPRQRDHLWARIDQLNGLGAPLLAILFDDMPGDQADLAGRQAEIVADICAWTVAERIIVCPTYYSFDPVLERFFGRRPENYWAQLGHLLAPEVDIFWTGNRVCPDSVSIADLQRARAEFKRPLVLWDNYPVNDGAVRSKHLFLDPLQGREQAPADIVHGHFCNPMIQARCSLPALTGLAALYSGAAATQKVPWLQATLGESTWRLLLRDSVLFRDIGLHGLGVARRQSLQAEYAALNNPAAAEVVGWLRGDDDFDPACLTD